MNEENKTKVDAIIRKWNGKRGSLIMALHELQGQFGYVPWDEALYLGQSLGIPMAKIYECLTFYNYFKLKAPGKYIISICDGTACHIKEGAGVLAELEKELGELQALLREKEEKLEELKSDSSKRASLYKSRR